jgi:hypothetical protein
MGQHLALDAVECRIVVPSKHVQPGAWDDLVLMLAAITALGVEDLQAQQHHGYECLSYQRNIWFCPWGLGSACCCSQGIGPSDINYSHEAFAFYLTNHACQ